MPVSGFDPAVLTLESGSEASGVCWMLRLFRVTGFVLG